MALKARAPNAGVSWRTVERAKARFKVTSQKEGDGPWTWRLPERLPTS
jgi:hypothetical protein